MTESRPTYCLHCRFGRWIAAIFAVVGMTLTAAKARAQSLPDFPDPPPPPPTQPYPGSPQAPSAVQRPTKEDIELNLYQACFQKMIDAGATDNAFMRRCLGLDERAKRRAKEDAANHQGLSTEVVRSAFAPALDGIRSCYGSLLETTKDLGITPEGTIAPEYELKPDGKVSRVSFRRGTLNDVSLLTCAKTRILALSFPKLTGGKPVVIRDELRLYAKSPRLAAISRSRYFPKLLQPAAGSDLSPEVILAVFRKNVPRVRHCYDELVQRVPNATGQAAADIAVSPAGRVVGLSFREFSINDVTFKTCVTNAIKHWRFPKTDSDDNQTIHYPPFVFSPITAGATKNKK